MNRKALLPILLVLAGLCFHVLAQPHQSNIGFTSAFSGGLCSNGVYSTFNCAGSSVASESATDGVSWLLGGPIFSHFSLNAPTIEQIYVETITPTIGKPLTISANIHDDNHIVKATLYYYNATAVGFDSVESAGAQSVTWTLPAAALTENGLAYFITATDQDLLTTVTPLLSLELDLPGDGLINRKIQSAGSEQNAYRLISFPGRILNNSPGQVFEDDLGKYDKKKWRFYEYDPKGKYVEFDQVAHIDAGRAYWLILKKDTKQLSSGKAATSILSESFSIPIQIGWNLVSNPFHFPIPVAQTALEDGDTPVFFGYEGKWNLVETDLMPFSGYAIYSETNTVLTISPLPFEQPALAGAGSFYVHDVPWQMRITARCQNAIDDENIFGVSASSCDGRDPLDRPEPPFIGDYVSLYSYQKADSSSMRSFCHDFKSDSLNLLCWDIYVVSNIDDVIEITIDDLAHLPKNREVWLVDDDTHSIHNLRQKNKYRIVGRRLQNPKKMQLWVGSIDCLNSQIAENTAIPNSFLLQQNYPNPFNAGTTIRFGLPRKGEVNLEIYNALGQITTTLIDHELMQKGYHSLIWDGRNDNHNLVSGGIYFMVLKADNFKAVRKMSFIR